jgi:quercetin dioxygenase-like cupin family protein
MIIRGHEAPTVPAEPGVTRQVLGHDDELMMVRVTFEQGAIGSIHSHPHRQVTYVERGRFEFTIDGATTTISEGDCCFVPPNARHGAKALGAGALIDVFTPARMDFLPEGRSGIVVPNADPGS